MFLVTADRQATKDISSKPSNMKDQYKALAIELSNKPFNGELYKSMKGERLFRLEEVNKRNFKHPYEIHSCRLNSRLRIVYEIIYNKSLVDETGKPYEGQVNFTNVGNHMYRRSSYAHLYSDN